MVSKQKIFPGKIDKGAIYAMTLVIILITLGFLLVGGTVPINIPTSETNFAIALTPTTEPAKNSLQLYTFGGITLTPTPTPTPTPTVTPSPTITPTLPPNSPGNFTPPDCAPPPTLADIQQQILQKYLIVLTGTDTAWAAQTYSTVCMLAKAPQYYSRLTAMGSISVNLHAGSCGTGHADALIGVDLNGSCDQNYNRYILGHELGHMFSFRNPSVYQQYLNTVWGQAGLLPTWDCQIHFGDGPLPAECWAAMIGEYLIYPYLRETVSGLPAGNQPFFEYPTTYSGYFNFARDNIFGGVKYF